MIGGVSMYIPHQIPYLLDKPFQNKITYQEYCIPELEELCMCIWTMKSENNLDKSIQNFILPDACIDLIIDFRMKTIYFSGFSKETELFELRECVDYMGVRFRPGAFYALFHVAADKVMDKMILFQEIEKKVELKNIFLIEDISKRINILKEFLLQKNISKSDEKYIKLVNQLYCDPKDKTVIDISKNMGYDKRQIYRIFKTNYGVSPKVLLNILRLHLCIDLLLENKKTIIEIAYLCGFYDQAHFIKEMKRYTGISPIQLLKMRENMSNFYNTNKKC